MQIYWPHTPSQLSSLQLLKYLFYLQFFLFTEDHSGGHVWFGASHLPHPLLQVSEPVQPLIPILQLHLETHNSSDSWCQPEEPSSPPCYSPTAVLVEEHSVASFSEPEQIVDGIFSCCFPPATRISFAERWFHDPGRGCGPSYLYFCYQDAAHALSEYLRSRSLQNPCARSLGSLHDIRQAVAEE